MKKLMIASAIAMAMTAGSAMAALGDAGSQGQVQFVGTVAAKTCDVGVVGNGAVNDLIQLGTVTKGQPGVDKHFSIKFKDLTCATGLTKANFIWSSPVFDTNKLNNQNGSATGSYVELKAKNGATNVANHYDLIGSGKNAVQFTFSDATAANGFEYTAKLTGGQTAGTFESAAAYTIVYE